MTSPDHPRRRSKNHTTGTRNATSSSYSWWRRTVYTCCLCTMFLMTSVTSLRHNFVAKDMHKTLIGPLGFPFGFTDTGSYNLTVFDFVLTIEDDSDHTHERQLSLDSIQDVGFLLKRFKDEAEFNHYINEVAADEAGNCIFEPFLDDVIDDDILGAEDDTYFWDDQFQGDNFDDDGLMNMYGDGQIVDDPTESGIFLSMKPRHGKTTPPRTASVQYEFHKGEEGLYFLLYQICPPPAIDAKHIHSKFELDFHFSNLDFMGNDTYLSAGEIPLPRMFFYFSLMYAICLYLWVSNIRLIGEGGAGRWQDSNTDSQDERYKAVVYPIHHLMTILLALKFCSLFFESIRYHFLRVTGHAYFWSGIYYTFTFLKGTFLFTVILLLGSGWSFVKPFLGEREKKIACLVLTLQVVNNIAIVVLTQRTEGERAFDRWTAILHMVDILCCCAVLIPIVWQVNRLEASIGNNGDTTVEEEIVDLQEDLRVPEDEFEEVPPSSTSSADTRLASKLKLFRSFYILVVGYIYATRIVVYLLAALLDYRHTWLRHFVVEGATLAFYFTVGMQFRPMSENPYLTLNQREDEGVAAAHRPKIEVELPVKAKAKKMKV